MQKLDSLSPIANDSQKNEIGLIQKLQSHLHRLRHDVQYETLQAQLEKWKSATPGVNPRHGFVLKRSLDRLEQALRESLTTIDLDIAINHGIASSLMEQAIKSLKSLCVTLEELANPTLLPDGVTSLHTNDSCAYPKLTVLLDVLDQDDEPFDLVIVIEGKRTLFPTDSIELASKADAAVTNFNCFFKQVQQPAVREVTLKRAGGILHEGIERARKFRNRQKQPFENILERLQEGSSCKQDGHVTLLQLVDINNATDDSVDFFMSTCTHPDHWFEAHLEALRIE